MNRNEFVAALVPAATANAARSGIPASLILAQAILESNWGTSKLAVEAKNLFGMKGSGPLGSVVLPTTEYRNGQPVRVNAAFRKYRNWTESLADHTTLLSAKRYAAVVNKSGPEAARAVAAAGYATDPLYAGKLIRLMSDYQLTRYDPPKGDDPMTPEEKKQFEALRQTVTSQAKRIAELEKFTQPGIPEWAKEAVAAAVSYSRNEPLLNNPEQGSVDFYRLITIMHRRGLFNR